MAYTPSNKRAKNCCKRTIQVQVIIEDVVAVFLEHSVYLTYLFLSTLRLKTKLCIRIVPNYI